jgi:hypothetical protein
MRARELKRVILKMFGDTEFYGYEIHKKISGLDVKIGLSRLYQILNEITSSVRREGKNLIISFQTRLEPFICSMGNM